MTLPTPIIRRATRPAVASSVRGSTPIDTIILHSIQGSLAAAEAVFSAKTATASAHYGIGKDGAIVRYLDDARAGWHAGNRPVNLRSIGIELEATCTEKGGPGDLAQFTPAMMLSLASLVSELCSLYPIPCARGIPGIAMHREVPDPTRPGRFGGAAGHYDPGPSFPLDALVTVVAGDRRVS